MGRRKFIAAVLSALVLIMGIVAVGGCGKKEVKEAGEKAGKDGGIYWAKRRKVIEDDVKLQMTLDGESSIWVVKGENWKIEVPDDYAIIVNAQKNNYYFVDLKEDTAISLPLEKAEAYKEMSPKAVLGVYDRLFEGKEINGDVLEGRDPATGEVVRAEFKGPRGAVSSIEVIDTDGSKEFVTLKYLDVGNISDSEFEIPQRVKMKYMEEIAP